MSNNNIYNNKHNRCSHLSILSKTTKCDKQINLEAHYKPCEENNKQTNKWLPFGPDEFAFLIRSN